MQLNPVSNWRKIFLPVIIALVFFGCRKDDSLTNAPIIHPDFTTKVTARNISGFVTNENNSPVQGATVKIGGSNIITDEYGFFEARNVLVVKQAATITVTQLGYFNGIKTFMAEEGKDAFFRIKLLPKTIAGTIDAAAGGQINTTSGVKISFPASAIVNAATNAAYTGNVHVAATWLDPTSPELNSIMPGDLRGIDGNNAMKLLTTYGMVAVELRGNGGELLQMAPGKKAGLTLPIPSSILASAPASIPLWSFDEEKGLWKEEGSAVKAGNTYVGEVGHFSFWNCDISQNFVRIDLTIKERNGTPLANALVHLINTNNPQNRRYGYTDLSGYVTGFAPGNTKFRMEIYDGLCPTILDTFIVSTYAEAVSFGVLTVDTVPNSYTNISGNVIDCNNMPVINGMVIMATYNGYRRVYTTAAGTYHFSHYLCVNSATVSLFAENPITNQQNTYPLVYNLNPGTNILPTIVACGQTSLEFLNLNVNGTELNFGIIDDINHEQSHPGSNWQYVTARKMNGTVVEKYGHVFFNSAGITNGSNQPIFNISTPGNQTTSQLWSPDSSNTTLHITEFGMIGQFISGNFNGLFRLNAPPNNLITLSGGFRVRRTQ